MEKFLKKIFKEYKYGEYSDETTTLREFFLFFMNIPVLTCFIFGMLKDYSIFLATLFKISLFVCSCIYFTYLFLLPIALIALLLDYLNSREIRRLRRNENT